MSTPRSCGSAARRLHRARGDLLLDMRRTMGYLGMVLRVLRVLESGQRARHEPWSTHRLPLRLVDREETGPGAAPLRSAGHRGVETLRRALLPPVRFQFKGGVGGSARREAWRGTRVVVVLGNVLLHTNSLAPPICGGESSAQRHLRLNRLPSDTS